MSEFYQRKDSRAINSTTRPRKLLDQVRDKMRSLHYALAENAYRHWIVEFLRFHRMTNRFSGQNRSCAEPDSFFRNLTVVATQGDRRKCPTTAPGLRRSVGDWT